MLLLTSTSDVIRITTGTAVNAISVHASFVDNDSGFITPGRGNSLITTATTVTIVDPPNPLVQRNVRLITITNTSLTACRVTVQHFEGLFAATLVACNLLAGESLIFNERGDWTHYNAQGAVLTATTTPATLYNSSTSTVTAGYAADTIMAGSVIALPSGITLAGIQYRCEFDMVKTAAGVGAPIVNIRFGTTGTVADPSICAMTFGAGTAVADTGKFTIVGTLRSAGAATAAVLAGSTMINHHLAATGLTSTGASGTGQVSTVGGGFNSTPANSAMSVSFNGGALFSGTCTYVQATLSNYRG